MEHETDKIDPTGSIELLPERADIEDDQTSDINSQNPKDRKIRFGLLILFVSSGLLIFMRSLIDNNIGKPTPFTFPERIEFAQAETKLLEAKQSATITDTKEFFGKPRYLYGKSYKYLLDDMPVDIDLRYAIGTDGDLPLYLKELGNIEIKEDELRQKTVFKATIGHYTAFDYQNRTYLTACINPRGTSTFTKEQFEDNASDRALDRDVVIGWLLGQKDLRDRRCLWTLMSTPITSASDRNATNQKLEKTWISWYEWWKPRFPTP